MSTTALSRGRVATATLLHVKRSLIVVTLAGALALASGCTPASSSSSDLGSAATVEFGTGENYADGMTTLETLPIKGRAPKTGYSRDEFGAAWADVDSNGCDTRNDILARDLSDITLDSDGCTVRSGTLMDSYTGEQIAFQRGEDTSSDVQIDHIVPLSDAWQKGAQQITPAQRIALANDPRNLIAVDGPTNSSKGDSDAATWLPPVREGWCTYVTMIVNVKATYALWVTQAEHDRIAEILSDCDTAPSASPTVTNEPTPMTSAPETAPEIPSATSSEEVATNNISYPNCNAVRAAGAAPIRIGDPGYSERLDSDKNGIGCE